jgi:uncharacterized protein (TIGR00255 family)
MTAYGRAEYTMGETLFVGEVRSVNHRYRDVVLRLPKNFQVLEQELRNLVSSRIRRGRVEVTIQMDKNGEDLPRSLELNEPLVNAYLKILNQLAEQYGLDPGIKTDTLFQMKDVILYIPEPMDVDGVRPGFHEVLKRALDSMDAMRLKEGEALAADLEQRIQLLDTYLGEVENRTPDLVEAYRMRLQESIQRMLNETVVDEDRLAQEVAYYADRSDITEEIVRTRSHINQFRDYLSMDDALGRRLDFLIQEIHREVNTLSVKGSDSLISKVAVEMKAELEKLREQVQNVE